MLAFYLKKIVIALSSPIATSLILILIAFILMLLGRKRLAIGLNAVAFTYLLLASTPFLPNYLLPLLEHQYTQYDQSVKVSTVVVLGCGHANDGSISPVSQLHACSLYRLNEGIRIWRLNPGASMYLSGYGAGQDFSNAATAKEVALALGVPERSMRIFETPKNTQEEAQAMAGSVGLQSFALVTSASHMPRAMAYFEAQGLAPIPAPTGYLLKDESKDPWWQGLPSARHLRKSERIIYEYLALAWLAMVQ